jgi:hypothetical protein
MKLFYKLRNFFERNEDFFSRLKKFEQEIVRKVKKIEENDSNQQKTHN